MVLLCVAVAASDRDDAPKAKVNIHGNKYLGLIPITEGELDPNSKTYWPYYLVFGQEQDKLYGAIVGPYIEREDDEAPNASPSFLLLPTPLGNGTVTGKKFNFEVYDPVTLQKYTVMTGRILKGGKVVELKIPVEGGGQYTMRTDRCCDGENYSGLYIGNANISLVSTPAAGNNAIFGLFLEKGSSAMQTGVQSSMTYGCTFIHPPSGEEPLGARGTGTIDKGTGQFEDDGDPEAGENDLKGVISKYKMNFNLITPQASNNLKLVGKKIRYFGSKLRIPRLKAPMKGQYVNPSAFGISLRIRTRNVLPGALLTEDSPDLYIISYGLFPKSLIVNFYRFGNAWPDEVKLTITNPDGKSATKTYALK